VYLFYLKHAWLIIPIECHLNLSVQYSWPFRLHCAPINLCFKFPYQAFCIRSYEFKHTNIAVVSVMCCIIWFIQLYVKAVEAYCELNVALCYVGVPVLGDKRGRYMCFSYRMFLVYLVLHVQIMLAYKYWQVHIDSSYFVRFGAR
jgi:hypothetical protein